MKKIALIPFLSILLFACHQTCDDGVQNQNETGVDCGGDCTVCETCTDGILNQDEIAIDCGGVCAPCPIEYPQTGAYGLNLLYGDDTLYVSQGNYSFSAQVPEGSSLKIKLTQVTGGVWYYALNTGGWTVSPYQSGQQYYEAQPGSVANDVQLNLMNMTGSFAVWYYENSTTIVAKSKIVVVQ